MGICKIKELRLQNGYKQKELGKILGVTEQQICNIENKRSELNSSQIEKLCNLFQVSSDYLLGIEIKKEL